MLIKVLVGFVNLLIKALGEIITILLKILPTSPFLLVSEINLSFLEELNWVIPIDFMISVSLTWLICIAIYYIVSIALRWIKVIQ